jgi:hypothetical protein
VEAGAKNADLRCCSVVAALAVVGQDHSEHDHDQCAKDSGERGAGSRRATANTMPSTARMMPAFGPV